MDVATPNSKPFFEFLASRHAVGGFTTEDVLASFLPLIKQTLAAHQTHLVAPLDQIECLTVHGVQIQFPESLRCPVRSNSHVVEALGRTQIRDLEIVAESSRSVDVHEGNEVVRRLDIGEAGVTPTRPLFFPGYTSWEHVVGHHDPLTDTFVLGLILASVACGLDFRDPDDLERFVANRRNLFAIQPDLHPVLAQAIFRMTEIDRSKRAQDLQAIAASIEGYRDQTVDFQMELNRVPGFSTKDLVTREQIVLSKLRERLFEVSRRNRLLHFQPTLQTINLTHASIPLSFDIQNIRPDQILVWSDSLQKQLSRGDAIPLSKSLNFAEAIYLPAAFDRLLAESRRDAAEYGFVQLRLVICFLHWADLKSNPVERYDSPLVLLPVKLVKKKGIRDTYFLEPVADSAEVNPVLRHLFQQLYNIELPEQIDLSLGSLDEFHQYLSAKIRSSEPAVVVNKLDRPRIELVHEKAKRRLDQYRRSARLAGRGIRSYLNFDYSYDPANYNPLGIQIYRSLIRPSATRLEQIVSDKPMQRAFAVPPAQESPIVEQERSMFQVLGGSEENPYVWNFDLCNLTLANFRYRKMSLVRDYDTLVSQMVANPAFESTFSLKVLSKEQPAVANVEFNDRYDVVPCDPTQATAIAAARSGASYIIQGPPGTGKSQTITNLIADFIARGKRVLFVCEKRAAIDVVFARLRQCGLGTLCCLIHDSQADKKSFILDLKQTYDSFVADPEGTGDGERREVLRKLNAELRTLAKFDQAMKAIHADVGVPTRELIDFAVQLSEHVPELTALDRERLPKYAVWHQHREVLDRFAESLGDFQPDGILANHPLRLLSSRLALEDRPVEKATKALKTAREALTKIRKNLEATGIPSSEWDSIELAKQLVTYTQQLAPIARSGGLRLLQGKRVDVAFDKSRDELSKLHDALAETQSKASGWRLRLPERDVPIALAQARQMESQFLSRFRWSWWKLRGLLHRSYNFGAHVVAPTWVQVLEWLEAEYAAQRALERHRADMCTQFGLKGNVEDLASRIEALRQAEETLPSWFREFRMLLAKSSNADRTIDNILDAEIPLQSLLSACDGFLEEFSDMGLAELGETLDQIQESISDIPNFLFCIRQLADVPQSISSALRHLPWSTQALEAACATHSLETVFKEDRSLLNFSGRTRDRSAERLEKAYESWLEANATEIKRRVRDQFVKLHGLAQSSGTAKSAAANESSKRFLRGLRELQHEFGKSMRFKAIRDLVASDSGEVIKSLKPVWLMSPLSVADSLPLDPGHFDVVIFDEASQITLEESVPPLFRSCQTIVVGDEQQLPPTDFFASKRSDEDAELSLESDGEIIHYDLESDSFLNHAAKNLPSWMLGWHYRSRSESLISFSNWAFYDGRLLTAPEEQLANPQQKPIDVNDSGDGGLMAAPLLERPVSFHHLPFGVYDQRRNWAEAEYIAELVRGVLAEGGNPTIGIVAFSETQQTQIENALQKLAQEDEIFRDRLEAEYEREIDGQFVGLLVKNLENMQGDERDIVILSICYGRGPTGKMLMNFGPINKSGGEKRLNVAFSRAKKHMAVVSSITADAITNDYNEGANCLKNYLRYAEACSAGNRDVVDRTLRQISRKNMGQGMEKEAEEPLVEQIADALRNAGWIVEKGVGQSHFRCDLAVRRDGDTKYRLGILVDGSTYYSQSDLLERDMQRPKLLRDFGWQVAVVLRKDWYRDRSAVMEELMEMLK